MCREAVGEAAHGQGKRRRHKVAYGLKKGIGLGVKGPKTNGQTVQTRFRLNRR